MFEWLNIKNVLDTVGEWHSLVLGFCDVISFSKTNLETFVWQERNVRLRDELWYYKFGRVLGVLCWVGFIKLIVGIF